MKFNSINNSNFSFGQFNREFEYDTDSLLTNSNWGNDTSYPDLSAILNGKDLREKSSANNKASTLPSRNISLISKSPITEEKSLIKDNDTSVSSHSPSENYIKLPETQLPYLLKVPSKKTKKYPSTMEVTKLMNDKSLNLEFAGQNLLSKRTSKKKSNNFLSPNISLERITKSDLKKLQLAKQESNTPDSNENLDKISPTIVNQSTNTNSSKIIIDNQEPSEITAPNQLDASFSQLMSSYQQCGAVLEKLHQQYNLSKSAPQDPGSYIVNQMISDQLEFINSSFVSFTNQFNSISKSLSATHSSNSIQTPPPSVKNLSQNETQALPSSNTDSNNSNDSDEKSKSLSSTPTHRENEDSKPTTPENSKVNPPLLKTNNSLNTKSNASDFSSKEVVDTQVVSKLDTKACKHLIEDIMILLNVKDPAHLLSTLKSVLLTLSQLIQLQPYLNTLDQLVYQTTKPKCLSLLVERFPTVTEIIYEKFGKQFTQKILNEKDSLMMKPGFRSLSCRFKI